MVDQRLTAKTELAEEPNDNDVFYVVDISDSTDSPEGTSKKIKYSNIKGGSTVFIKEGGGTPTTNDDKYTGGNNGFGGQETPEHPLDVDGVIRKRGTGQSNGIEFQDQVIYALSAAGNSGHTTIQEKVDGQGTRFYLMPKGTIAGADSLASGIKFFSTDYEADDANYHDMGIWVTQNELIMNSKKNGTFPSNLPFVWKYQDTNKIMKLQAKDNAALMLGVPDANEKNWTVFEPFHLGNSTVLLGRSDAATSEWINNAYFDGSWKRIVAGEAHRYSLDANGDFVFWTAPDGAINTAVSWTKRYSIKNDGQIIMHSIPTYADDASAGVGGLIAGSVYKTATGELRIKL